MAIFRLIPHGDLALSAPDPITGKRRVVMVTGAQYARQKIQARLKFFEKEWFIDRRQGVPYYTEVYVANPNLDRIRTMYRKIILSVQEVVTVDKLTLAFTTNTRALAVEFDCSLVSGGTLSVRQPDPPFIITLPRAA